jgi:glycosyltransferase involved in cell wall biosynthesis
MKFDKVSVIIPSLNEEKLINKVLNQFSPEVKKKYNLEVIVSDGGSVDNTLNLLNGSVDKVIRAEKDMKQNIAIGRNNGAKNSAGDVLVFLNADTVLGDTDKFFNAMEKAFSENSGTVALSCPVKIFPEEEIMFDKIFHFMYNNYIKLLNKLIFGMGRGECHIVKREYFFRIRGYNENFALGEDFDLYKRLKKIGKIKFEDDCLVYESPRRFRKYGYLRVLADWVLNSFSIVIMKKPIYKNWKGVR